jgi:hypothetical protein
MPHDNDIPRDVLPIPDRKTVALTTYDARDPDTKVPPIRRLRPPAGAPNVHQRCREAGAGGEGQRLGDRQCDERLEHRA